MDNRVGSILREARNRRKLDHTEVEAALKIRARYLRAIESEEWGVLPGGAYTRSFIRTYAAFLGLDGERLVADYRTNVEGATGASESAEPGRAAPAAASGSRRKLSHAGWLAVMAAALTGAVAILLIPGSGSEGVNEGRDGRQDAKQVNLGNSPQQPPIRAGISLRLTASAEVWVCLLDAQGQHLVDGQILEAGAEEGPFRSGSFTVSFGNGEVSMLIDGREAEIPATSSPLGYSIDAAGALSELGEAERPTCL